MIATDNPQTLVRVISVLACLAALSWAGMGLPMRIAPAAALRAAVANILVMGGILLTMLRAGDESYLSYQVAYLLMLAGLIAFRSGLQKLAALPVSIKEDVVIMLSAG
ncbi:MAG TPA: hypothetical protein VJ001_11080, partial [Rhodocyclaceae bacterium]|nr:hypothetical protein [Rhodocyclaceae bacterium]